MSAQPTDTGRRARLAVAPEPSDRAGAEAALFSRLADAEAALKAIDGEISAHEEVREGAVAGLKADPRPDMLAYFALEERRDLAVEAIAELLARRRPIAVECGRLNGYAAPIRKAAEELAYQRTRVAVEEKLAEVFPLLDRVLEVIDQAAELGRGTGMQVHSTLDTKFRKLWGPGAWSRDQLEYTITANLEGARAAVERLKGSRR